jgi:hypothetical protein
VLDPLLRLEAGAALRVAERFFTALLGPRPPSLLDVAHLLDDLLAPRRELTEEAAPIPEPDLEPFSETGRFSPVAVAAARRVLEAPLVGPRRLSALLENARERSDAPVAEVAELVRLGALWAYAPEPSDGALLPPGARSVDDGTELGDPDYGGADLLLVLTDAVGEETPGGA